MNATDLLTTLHARTRMQAAVPASPHALPAILSLATASPRGRYGQRQIYEALSRQWPSYRHPRIEQFFMDSDIDYRNMCLDVDTFNGNETIDEMHGRFVTGATGMGCDAIRTALTVSGVAPAEIDFLVVATCTGYVCPGLGSLYAKEFGFPKTLQRAELVGMGCAGALPAMQRAYDFVRSNPGKKALVVTVEVCSACYYLDDSPETIIGNAICADGAAAMVVGLRGDDVDNGGNGSEVSAYPRIVGFRTLHETSFIDKVGFAQKEGRLRIVLSKDLRDAAGGLVRQVVDGILEEHGLQHGDISHWILHPGGRKIIDAVQAGLGLTDAQVRHSKSVLRNFGNMSSPTVLFVLEQTARPPESSDRPKACDLGVMIAMGPGLAVEGALVQW
jgi:polyketide synthase Type III